MKYLLLDAIASRCIWVGVYLISFQNNNHSEAAKKEADQALLSFCKITFKPGGTNETR